MMHFCCCLCGHVLAARLVLEQSTVVTWWGSAKQQCAGGEVWHSNRDTETFTCVEDPEVITLSFARVAPWSYAAGAAEKRSSAASLALGPTASVGFSPDNPQSPEAEQVPFHPSICLEKHLSCSTENTCTTAFNSTSSLNCWFQSDDPASNANSYLFGDFYL